DESARVQRSRGSRACHNSPRATKLGGGRTNLATGVTAELTHGPLHELPPPAPDCPVRVVATRVNPAREDDKTVRFVSGWGATIEEASLGCEREAAERYSAQFAGDEPVERAEIHRLDGAAVSPSEILLVSEEQLARRHLWNAVHPGFNELPEPWDASRPIDWIAADEAFSSTRKLLPAGL